MSDLDERDAGDAVDLLGSGIAKVAGAAGGAQVGKEAATGAAVGAAVGTVLEAVPVAGPILHAIAIAAGAFGGAISGALRDTYHPSALQAAICLLLCRVAPGMVYAGFDTINTGTRNAAAYACRLVRYWRLLCGLVPFTGPLYNPRNDGYRALLTDRPKKQPYIESGTPDPQEALTDVRVTRHLRELVVHFGHQPAAPGILPLVRTEADAQAILAALRAHLAESGVLGWDPIKTNLRGLRIAVGKVMTIAGETKPDPLLSNLLGGEVRPQALRRREHGPHAPAPARRLVTLPAAPAHARPMGRPAAYIEFSASDPFTAFRGRTGFDAGSVGATARNDAGAVAGPTRAVLFFGPVGASQREGATLPGAEEHFFTCTGNGHPNCAQKLGAYCDGAGRFLPGLLRHLGVREGADLFIGAFSAGGSAVKRLLLSADDRTAIRAVVLSDATYELWTDAQQTRPNVAEGYVAFALEALGGSKLFVATASANPNNASGVQQPSGSQTLARLAAEIGMRSGQPLEERDTLPGYETLVPAPDRVWTRGGVILADFGSKLAHAAHVTQLAPMLWPAVVQPWAVRHTATSSEASGTVGSLDDTGDPFDTVHGGATMLAERDVRRERARARAAALLRRLVDHEDLDGAEEDVGAPGPGRSRLYAPPAPQQEDSGHREPGREPRAHAVFPSLVLVHGVSPQGIDTPGLVRLAKALAASGLTVLTPEIPELAGGRLDPGAVDGIAQAVLALADRTGAPVGLVGLSIGGGLSLLAAARCADSLRFVCTIGAHHDLGRVARFCLTNWVERIDEGAHRLEADPAGRRMLADLLRDGASEAPSDLLTALVEAREALAALSPAGRLGDLSVPVFVLHGADDNLIPAAEAEWIAREVPEGMLRRQLVTPALSHVDLGALGDVSADATAALVEFLADLLAHAETMADPFTDPEDPHQGETMLGASAPFQVLPTGAAPDEAGTVFDDAAARANQAVDEARAYLSETWLGKALGIEPEPEPPHTADPGFELYSAGQTRAPPREGDAGAPGDSDAGGLLDFIFDPEAREAERLRQRAVLKSIPWVKDSFLGRFLNLDDPAPLPAPAPPPRPLVLVPEAAGEAGAPLDADAVRDAILAAPPRAVSPAWNALDAPAQIYWWDPFGETWARMGDGRDREMAKVLAVFFLKETHFPVSYCLLHSAEGSEVIRAEKHVSQDPPAGEGTIAAWRPVKAGVSHLWIPAYTFHARSFPPGETVRFDFSGAAGGGKEAGAPAGWAPTYLPEARMAPEDASDPFAG